MAKKNRDLVSAGLRTQMTAAVAWGLTIGSFFVPLGLLLAPSVLGLWWLHRRSGRVPATAVGLALVALAYNAFFLASMSQ